MIRRLVIVLALVALLAPLAEAQDSATKSQRQIEVIRLQAALQYLEAEFMTSVERFGSERKRLRDAVQFHRTEIQKMTKAEETETPSPSPKP